MHVHTHTHYYRPAHNALPIAGGTCSRSCCLFFCAELKCILDELVNQHWPCPVLVEVAEIGAGLIHEVERQVPRISRYVILWMVLRMIRAASARQSKQHTNWASRAKSRTDR